jgi:ketosteroid isomerase-like protein
MDFQSLSCATEELAVHGDSACATGTLEAVVLPEGGKPATDRGSYMVLFIRDSTGTWRSHRGVFNSSLPLPEP